MLPLRFIILLVILLAGPAWCKPAKNSDGLEYSDDDPPSDYNDTVDDEDEPSTSGKPPRIVSAPKSIHVRNGSTIWLPCLVENAEQLTLTWKKGDELLYYDSTAMTTDKDRILHLPNNTLVIYNSTAKDSSNDYECSILNNPPITIKHRVLVDSVSHQVPSATHRPPLVQVVPSKKVEVNATESVTLGCETRIQPTPEIKWYHENERLQNNGKVVINGNRITINDINRHDAGHYRCMVENHGRNPPVEEINLIVYYAPEIETKSDTVHTGLGVESRITCIVHAHPHAKVTWYKEGDELVAKPGFIEMKRNKTRYEVVIPHTRKEDFGDYTCMATNRLGLAQRATALTGLPSQAIISGGEITKTSTGLILKWQLESYSPITEYKLKYRRLGDKDWVVITPTVTNGSGTQFTVQQTIEGLQPGSYEAILQARNNFGWSLPSMPHTFMGDYEDVQANAITELPSSAAPQFALSIATFLLVVSSCAFTNL